MRCNSNRKKIIVVGSIILVILVIALISVLIYKKVENDKIKLSRKRQQIYEEAVSYCESLYIDGMIKDNTTIKSIDDFLRTTGSKEFKHRLIIEKNLKKKLEAAGFDIKKLWSKAPSGLFKDVPNDSDKIKIV